MFYKEISGNTHEKELRQWPFLWSEPNMTLGEKEIFCMS